MYGIIAGARVKFMDEDACKGSVKCSIASGMTYTYTDSIFCRKEYPEVSNLCNRLMCLLLSYFVNVYITCSHKKIQSFFNQGKSIIMFVSRKTNL